jgi:hypothetical protein
MIVAALSLASQLFVTVADKPPILDIEPSCRAAARANVVPGRNEDSCRASERAAHDQLATQWAQFAPTDRRLCSDLSTAGGSPSYVELLSCLEMRRDAREIARQAAPAETTGSR